VFNCPHCHKTIEIGIGPDGKVPWYRTELGNPKVSLGCGTLIVIGIIVAFCSGGISDRDLDRLRGDIQRLERKVDELAAVAAKPAAISAAEAAPVPLP
jgi:outer membrane murein-binding lipoprotein Lpp